MDMANPYTTRNNSREQGSALLLTLGVLSLVLILAMAFAFTARTERQISRVNADQHQAKALAESTLNTVMAHIRFNFVERTADGTVTGLSALYPAVKNYYPTFDATLSRGDGKIRAWVLEGTDDSDDPAPILQLHRLATILSQTQPLKFMAEKGTALDLAAARFDTAVLQQNIIGRHGAIILEEGSRLDLNQMLSLSQRVPHYSAASLSRPARFDTPFVLNADFFLDLRGDSELTGVSETNTRRMGLAFTELQADPGYFTALPLGYNHATRTPWFSYIHLINKAPAYAADLFRYTFFSPEDIEAYWDPASQTERQRFDLSGYAWRPAAATSYYDSDSKPVPAASGWQHPTEAAGTSAAATYARNLVAWLIGSTQRAPFWSDANRTVLNPPPAFQNQAAPLATFGIPALRTMTGSYSTLTQQIAANLVDFCDGDSFATTNTPWNTTTEPAYCGNEQVPYFNEFTMTLRAERTAFVEAGVDKFLFRLRLMPTIELVNIFAAGALPAGACRLRIALTCQLKGKDSSNNNVALPAAPLARELTFDFSPGDVNPLGYLSHAFTEASTATLVYEVERTSDLSNAAFTLTLNRIVALAGTADNDAQIQDIAFWNSSSGPSATLPATGIPELQTASLEVADPRCNHRSLFWKWKTDGASLIFSSDNSNHTQDDDNTDLNNAAGGDLEETVTFTGTTPQTFSTAFIRNAPPHSLWELGAIHRGEPFRTINLTAFSATTGSYASGDAILLDQVKLGPGHFTRGKFNANARNPQAAAELVKGIDLNDDYSSACAYTPAATPPTFAEAMWGDPAWQRGAFVAVLNQAFPAPRHNRQAEALIGRTAQLLTTRNDAYTIITIGQSLRQLRNVLNDTQLALVRTTLPAATKYFCRIDENGDGTEEPLQSRYCSILATQKIQAQIVRDAWRNTVITIQKRYMEE